MQIASSAFADGENIPAKYTCDGEDTSPQLEFSLVPKEAASLALIMDDPDAPGGTYVHWVLWNMKSSTQTIPETESPEGSSEGKNDFGKTGYGGPCPPDKEHRYFFKLYALDTTLDLPESTTKQELERAMEGHILGKAELVGRYDRQ